MCRWGNLFLYIGKNKEDLELELRKCGRRSVVCLGILISLEEFDGRMLDLDLGRLSRWWRVFLLFEGDIEKFNCIVFSLEFNFVLIIGVWKDSIDLVVGSEYSVIFFI